MNPCKIPASPAASLDNVQPRHCLVRLWLFNAQPLHQPPVLLRRELPLLLAVPRPLETPALQPLVQQHKAVSLLVQPFDPILPPPAEQKQRVLEWIQLEPRLRQPRQPVAPPPQIRISAGQVYRTTALEIVQHDFSIRMIVWIVSASAPAWISTCSSPHWMLAAISVFIGLTGTSAKHTSFSANTASNTFLCQLIVRGYWYSLFFALRLPAARSSSTSPLAGPTPPNGCCDLLFAVLVPSSRPSKIYSITNSAIYYPIVHGTLSDSIVFSCFPFTCARRYEI